MCRFTIDYPYSCIVPPYVSTLASFYTPPPHRPFKTFPPTLPALYPRPFNLFLHPFTNPYPYPCIPPYSYSLASFRPITPTLESVYPNYPLLLHRFTLHNLYTCILSALPHTHASFYPYYPLLLHRFTLQYLDTLNITSFYPNSPLLFHHFTSITAYTCIVPPLTHLLLHRFTPRPTHFPPTLASSLPA